ncbi:hypothetical protein A1Q2_02265 [Trichosporon asahii var. asahii CBS 8904]|uniref:Uncharacterized protein n=1 Tax=Trichosporon asahii var. asahii (strain CBS 8904) TaxID=1220162 RepID=K1W3I9_TRIAC|nr:hypothetical protein A1Q2_02265 [Trichosporon asahii var. asahii CBS 8904]
MSRPGGSGPSAPRVPEDGAALSVRRLKRIAEDGPPVVGTIKRPRGGFARNDSGLPPSVGFAGSSGGGGRGRGRGRGGSFNHGGGNNANRGGHSHRGGPHRGRGGGPNSFRGGRGQPGGSRGRGRGRGRGGKGGFQPTGANAEPQTDYYSTGADLYADYADVGTGEEAHHGHEEDHEPQSPPPAPRIGRPELTDSYRPERHALPPRPAVRSPGGSPHRSMPPLSSPPRMVPPSTPAQPTPSRVSLLSSSPVARFHLDSDMVFELASEADHADHDEPPARKEKEREVRRGYGEYTYSPSSPLPELAASTHDDGSWNSALGLTTAPAPKPAAADKGKEKEKQPTRPPLPPLEKDDKLAPKPLKIKPMNRNVRKNDPPKPPSLALPKEKEEARLASKSPVVSRPPLAVDSRSKSPMPSQAVSGASTSAMPAASSSAAPLTSTASSSSIINIPPPPRMRTPEPIELSSSPLVATSSIPGPAPRSPEDVKPNLALLAPSSPPPAPAPAASMPREGVLALRRADLPTDCFSTDRIRRVPARHIVAQDAKARVVAEGKIVLGTRWRDDGFCVDWQLPARPESDSDDSDDSGVEFVAAPPRPPPPVVEIIDSSEDEEPLARKPKSKRKGKSKRRSEEPGQSRDHSAAATTATTLSPTRSPPPRAFARVPSTGTQRGVDSSTLPHDPETPESGPAPLPLLDSDERDADKWAEYVAANPNGSIVLPFPVKFQKEDSRQTRGYVKWKERQLVLFRTYRSHVASNEVTSAETDGKDAWAPGLRVRWRALSEDEISAAIEKRRREKRERREAKKAAKEAKEADRRSASVRPREPSEPHQPEQRTNSSWVAAQDPRPIEERDELDEEESKDDIAERAARQEKEKERKKSDRAERRAMAKQPQDSAPRPSASPAFPLAALPSHALPAPTPTPLVQPSALSALPAPAVGSVPSPPPSPLPLSETSPEDAELARLQNEISAALEKLDRWQRLKDSVPGKVDVVSAQIEQVTLEVFSLQTEYERLLDAKKARRGG